jgi:hypothetical protein
MRKQQPETAAPNPAHLKMRRLHRLTDGLNARRTVHYSTASRLAAANAREERRLNFFIGPRSLTVAGACSAGTLAKAPLGETSFEPTENEKNAAFAL